LAFGSAGGSSAQFGVKLTSSKATKAWDKLVLDYGNSFQCANYWSQVDTLPGDYLNTYYASDESVWGVGSFLGSDRCKKDDIDANPMTPMIPTNYMGANKGPVTTMGGMAAMACGLGTKLSGNTMDGTSDTEIGISEIESAMATGAQATFASAFKTFITENYADTIVKEWESKVRFIAKTFGVIGMGKGFLPTVFSGKYGRATKMSYSYMINLGLMPQQFHFGEAGDIVATEMQQNLEENGLQKDDYAWLMAAAKIGFFKSKKCKSMQVCTFKNPVQGAGNGISPCATR